MKVGIVKEVHPGERRVALSPAAARKVIDRGFEVLLEAGAGAGASYPDSAYVEAGARPVEGARAVWEQSDIVVKVRPPGEHPELGVHEAELLREAGTLVSFIWPGQNAELLDRLAARQATVLAMDAIPRISRAQKMDALSSMANIAGYRAVVEAANQYGSFFTGQFTAAGRVAPAKVLVIGAGVAGLAAIAAARGLGAIVRAFDTREAVRDQVKSLGGEFLELEFSESGEGAGGYAKVMSKEFIEAEMALFREQALEVDIVITTALVPGKPAPKLWTADMVESMKPGSVIVDMAAEQGGNCELTRPGEVAVEHGVTIIGYADLPSRMANVASDLYGTNIYHLLDEMGGGNAFGVDLDDEVVRDALVLHGGQLTWPPPTRRAATPAPVVASPPTVEGLPAVVSKSEPTEKERAVQRAAEAEARGPGSRAKPPLATTVLSVIVLALVAGWVYVRVAQTGELVSYETRELLQHLTVFVLAIFVGWQVVWAVTPALHTPLMSVTNAISGIIIIGGMLQMRGDQVTASMIIGGVATMFAAINIIGGFWITQRMLKMFRK